MTWMKDKNVKPLKKHAHCECTTWCRDPVVENAEHSRWPLSWHHPNCPAYKTETFYRISIDGSSAIVEASSAEDAIGDFVECEIAEVQMTREQWERLPEFAGF